MIFQIHGFFLSKYKENHQITPAARRVERQAASDFYCLKTLYFPSVSQVPGVGGVSFERFPRPRQTVDPISGPYSNCWQLFEARVEHNAPSIRVQSWSDGEIPAARHPQTRAYGGRKLSRDVCCAGRFLGLRQRRRSVASCSRKRFVSSFASMTASQKEVTASPTPPGLRAPWVPNSRYEVILKLK